MGLEPRTMMLARNYHDSRSRNCFGKYPTGEQTSCISTGVSTYNR